METFVLLHLKSELGALKLLVIQKYSFDEDFSWRSIAISLFIFWVHVYFSSALLKEDCIITKTLLWSLTINIMYVSRVAQWKRAGPITQRSVDRNHALLNIILWVNISVLLKNMLGKILKPVVTCVIQYFANTLLTEKTAKAFSMCLSLKPFSSCFVHKFKVQWYYINHNSKTKCPK